jgi:hypothetical protein
MAGCGVVCPEGTIDGRAKISIIVIVVLLESGFSHGCVHRAVFVSRVSPMRRAMNSSCRHVFEDEDDYDRAVFARPAIAHKNGVARLLRCILPGK